MSTSSLIPEVRAPRRKWYVGEYAYCATFVGGRDLFRVRSLGQVRDRSKDRSILIFDARPPERTPWSELACYCFPSQRDCERAIEKARTP